MTRLVTVDQLKDGDILAEDIFTDQANMSIVVKSTVINERVIKRLKELGIGSLLIFDSKDTDDYEPKGNSSEKITNKKEVFKEQYKNSVSNVKNLFNDIMDGKSVSLEKITDISDEVFKSSEDIYAAIESIGELKEIDEYTYAHSINVALYSMLLGKWLNLSEDSIESLVKSAVLHDIGKSKIDESILNKPGTLSDEEFEEIKKHTTYGYNICQNFENISDEVKNGILMHHERIDGTGYPMGLKDQDISLFAKIIGICDVYDAITSERAYREKSTPFDTFNELIDIGYDKLDTKIMLIFLNNIGSLYIGSKVKMNTGEIGEIIFIPSGNIDKPIVKIGNDYCDLSKNSQYRIIEML
ncbi:HD domain-containing metal dependent phosphohydrolase [Gottschalkia acidurici 9a]|uniref:HD domain-containing metal dependent phosphohydrolase n=1 Tax=Gottschalkia acidurici (strain ATCC 7906 / DSM 604 / BCRC 14475 / CIP 104303 / KCTC 5404 / NCIMB 10678 / 9a) TaxID=1128398 RepID=K0AWZ4_GOTA9|nr:HD-GYP domain-containing protein [Gottschalkia acidurici]AFS77759.1 HD domain-containing metal dependent phosphohydrolase [Gottschalkia acidurici 9a]